MGVCAQLVGGAGVLLAVAQDAGAQGPCTSHASCSVNFYCDGSLQCYTCSYITPVTCDAFDQNCCSPVFLAQCPTNPAQCPPPPPPPPPASADSGGNGWTITILIVVAASVYVGGGLGYVRYVSKDEDESKPLLENHPHYQLWQEIATYASEGVVFFRALIGNPADNGPISSANKDSLEVFDDVPPAQSLATTPRKKKKPKSKPNPAKSKSADRFPLLDVDVDTGSPQAPVE